MKEFKFGKFNFGVFLSYFCFSIYKNNQSSEKAIKICKKKSPTSIILWLSQNVQALSCDLAKIMNIEYDFKRF